MTGAVNYNVEVEMVEERTTIIEELMTPTFIALAASVAAATGIVILLLGLICHRLCRAKPGYTAAKVASSSIRSLSRLVLILNLTLEQLTVRIFIGC